MIFLLTVRNWIITDSEHKNLNNLKNILEINLSRDFL